MFKHKTKQKDNFMRRNKNYVLTVILDDELKSIKDYLMYERGFNLSVVVRNFLVKLYETEKNKDKSWTIPTNIITELKQFSTRK